MSWRFLRRTIQQKIVKIEITEVEATNSPASSGSFPISFAMENEETATGEATQPSIATRGICLSPARQAAPMTIPGIKTNRKRETRAIAREFFRRLLTCKVAPRTTKARGVATFERFSREVRSSAGR